MNTENSDEVRNPLSHILDEVELSLSPSLRSIVLLFVEVFVILGEDSREDGEGEGRVEGLEVSDSSSLFGSEARAE